jgi:hypothetical protein
MVETLPTTKYTCSCSKMRIKLFFKYYNLVGADDALYPI